MIGVGKTTVGRALAQRLGWGFEDLDLAMEALTGKTFRDVVADEGWLRFREYEYQICKDFAQKQRSVVGLGGGTVRYQWNRDAINGSGVNVLLTAGLEELARRVCLNDRPRVNQGTTLEEDLEAIWNNHQELYTSFADIVYPTDRGKNVEEEVNDLLEMLRKYIG